jgi:single-strand DNA-binding protein
MNNLVITGNLGADPKIRFSKDNKAIVTFSLAVGQRVKKDGEWTDGKTMWFQATFFGATHERLIDALKKGDTVCVTGRLGQSEYTPEGGETKSSLDIIGSDVVKVERIKKADNAVTQSEEAPF